MAAIIEVEATVTERGQTTIPAAIRHMLRLGKRGAVVFRGMPDGTVVITNRDVSDDGDPVLGQFLAFLARNIAERPQIVAAVNTDLVRRVEDLIGGIDVDLDQALPDDEA